jgi:hypothetical protein
MAFLRRQTAIADRVAQRAEQGLSSVWPMFLAPEESMGELFLIEGTARRAVRIVVDDASAADAVRRLARREHAATPLREYYEVDVFTTDSQNQPVICCAARLPAGFPEGDVIREPIRMAGVFFKRWAYARRPAADPAAAEKLPERLAAPLMLAAELQWLRPVETSAPVDRGLGAGIALAAALAVVWAFLARVARRDRLARQRRARYDAPLDQFSDPESTHHHPGRS